MKLFLILLILLIAVPASGSSGWQASDKVWDCIYFMGAGYLTISFDAMGMPYWSAYALTIILAIVKEYMDQIYHEHGYPEHWYWDRRGGNPGDVFCAAASIVISFPISLKFKK